LIQDGQIKAFCLQEVTDIPLVAPYSHKNQNINGWQFYPQIFERVGCDLLDAAQKKKLIFLDEIGGIELLLDSIYKKLY
jgi:nucleoside-triphosphatase THEP1